MIVFKEDNDPFLGTQWGEWENPYIIKLAKKFYVSLRLTLACLPIFPRR